MGKLLVCYSPRRNSTMPPKDCKKNFLLSLVKDKMIGDHYSVTHSIPKVVDLMSEIAEHL